MTSGASNKEEQEASAGQEQELSARERALRSLSSKGIQFKTGPKRTDGSHSASDGKGADKPEGTLDINPLSQRAKAVKAFSARFKL